MPFPESQRIIYGRNTLQQVICQIRFPSILRIESQIPDAYQDSIREAYPFFNERTDDGDPIPAEIAAIVPEKIKQAAAIKRRYYEFVSADKHWTITLARDSIALTTTQYTRWEEFKTHLENPLTALIQLYKPAFFSRIGLRYQNLIQRSELGLDGVSWSLLFKPHIAGPLGDDDIGTDITGIIQILEVDLGKEIGTARVQHGTVIEEESKEQCYLIDSDFFTEDQTEVNDGLETLAKFNQQGTRLFQWFITPRLSSTMDPSIVERS